jgi:hypothetical protein
LPYWLSKPNASLRFCGSKNSKDAGFIELPRIIHT